MLRLNGEVLSDRDACTAREWLVTNGLGGYACGTVSGIATRRYHGLLVAALHPPRGRHVLVTHLDETITLRFLRAPLSTHAFTGAVHPDGHKHLTAFEVDPLPTWRYRVGSVLLERSVCMVHGQNTTLVRYTLLEAPGAVALTVRPFGAFRDFHHHTRESGQARIAGETSPERPGAVVLRPFEGLPPVTITAPGVFQSSPDWWRSFEHGIERARGLDATEDLFTPGEFVLALAPGETAHVVITCENKSIENPAAAEAREVARLRALVPDTAQDPGLRALYRAVDVYRADAAKPPALLAGYPWFEDWGRDTLIAFTGAYLVPGRYEEARSLLAAFARYVDQGMLPNRFPDGAAGHADYNTVDAPMWFFHAARRFVQYTNDHRFGHEVLLPAMRAIDDGFRRGTRYGIHVGDDGLVYAGDPGTQLTWMDARIGDHVVTSRHGAPVEINALWHTALRTLAWMHGARGDVADAARYAAEADRVRGVFTARFWSDDTRYLHDVVRGEGSDPAVRPNALLAAALPGDLLDVARAEAVVARARRELWVPFALRTLRPGDPGYRGRYEGDPWSRDTAYHQGTAWPFLMGWYASAVVRTAQRTGRAGAVDDARAEVLRCYAGLPEALTTMAVGHLPEVLDGDPPHRFAGCFAQAWSDAEALRALVEDGHGEGPADVV